MLIKERASECFMSVSLYDRIQPRSNVDLGLKTICAIARSRRVASTGVFLEALQPSGADHQGVVPPPPPPPPPLAVAKHGKRARVKFRRGSSEVEIDGE